MIRTNKQKLKMQKKKRTIFLTMSIVILTMFHMTTAVKAAYQKAENKG